MKTKNARKIRTQRLVWSIFACQANFTATTTSASMTTYAVTGESTAAIILMSLTAKRIIAAWTSSSATLASAFQNQQVKSECHMTTTKEQSVMESKIALAEKTNSTKTAMKDLKSLAQLSFCTIFALTSDSVSTPGMFVMAKTIATINLTKKTAKKKKTPGKNAPMDSPNVI